MSWGEREGGHQPKGGQLGDPHKKLTQKSLLQDVLTLPLVAYAY